MACEGESMEDEPSPVQVELTCPVCKGIFQEPMLLRCTHSFCRDCLWQSFRNSDRCPVCRMPFTDSEPIFNRGLADTCEAFRKEEHRRPTKRRAGGGGVDTCNIHLRPLELFCLKDEELVCVDCVTLHNPDNHHKLLPLAKALPQCKDELQNKVKILKKKVKSYKEKTEKFGDAVQHVKCQAELAEKQIKAEFVKLHEALDKEEALRLKALSDEEDQKIAALNKLIEDTGEEISALNEVILTLEREMGNEDLPFLKKFQNLKRQGEWIREEPQIGGDSLLNLGRHVGALGFKVWKKMQDHITYYPVVLDPNTAYPWLSLNDDLTSVKESPELLTLPENPERFSSCIFILGTEGYTSGKHRWDVDVSGHSKWVLGVCKESVARKKKFTLSTSRGVWSIALSKGVYTAMTPERTQLEVQQPLEKIRIKLNMDKGEVSFYDGGNATHLVTLSDRFDEKMFPIFGPFLHSTPMVLEPGKIVVHTS